MSAFCHRTDFDHGGASGEDVMADQVGSPEREMEVTSQPLLTATLHIREPGVGQYLGSIWVERLLGPRKPLPPHTTIFFAISLVQLEA